MPPGVSARTTDPEATQSLAAALARQCVPGDVLLLAGGLGAGKTTFAQGFGRALGIDERITSPTFTLVRQYRCDAGPLRMLLHADVYRLDSLQEVVDLGLGELVEDDAVALVEWGDVAEPVLGTGSLLVHMAAPPVGDESERIVTVAAVDNRWDERWAAVAAALAPWTIRAEGQ